jgi:anti-sigma B factor antagonist
VLFDPVEQLSVSFAPDEDGNVVIILQGEIDIATADQVWAALTEALTAWTGQVVADFAGVTFLDSQGIATLIKVHKDCDLDSKRLTIRSPQPQTRQVFELTGLDQILEIVN